MLTLALASVAAATPAGHDPADVQALASDVAWPVPRPHTTIHSYIHYIYEMTCCKSTTYHNNKSNIDNSMLGDHSSSTVKISRHFHDSLQHADQC